jgi:Uma2 family endonuclease/transcriptional regulator with XRE-family HTH domain
MDAKELKARKKALKLTTAQLAYLAELPVSTVSKIMTGETKSPSYVTIEKIGRALAHEEMLARVRAYADELLAYVREHPDEQVDQIRFEKEYRKRHKLDNAPLPYAKPVEEGAIFDGSLALSGDGRVTTQILSDIGEDRRIELIDGHLIINEMPGLAHQMLVQNLGKIIDRFIEKNKGKCLVFSVGVNVRLDEDDYTVVIPDITVLCDRSKMEEKGIAGAPDWVIEVISPSTRSLDYKTKMLKYMNAGVREYWIIDLEKSEVVTYIEGEPMMVYVYKFSDEVPVYIYDGKLKIKLEEIAT